MPRFRVTAFRVAVSIFAAIALSAFIYSFWFSPRALLKKYGVTYDDDSTAFASSSLMKFTCFRIINGKKYEGPSVIGTMLEVEAPSSKEQVTPHFRVRSSAFKTYFVDIELLPQPNGNQAFRVVNSDSSMLDIHYLEQGITGAP